MGIITKVLRAGDEARISRFHTLRGELIPKKEILTLPIELVLRVIGFKRKGPWLSRNAISALSDLLTDGKHNRVLEIGGGESTAYFAKRSSFLMTIEEDSSWAARIQAKIKKNDNGFQLVISSLEEWLPTRTENNMDFDIVLIDGGSDSHRLKALEILPKLNPNAVFVLDNSDRNIFGHVDFHTLPKRVIRYSGMIRHPFQATETTFYYF